MVGALSPFWKESLEFFGLGNLKLFVLATLNNFRNSLAYFFKYFWWMLAVVIIAQQTDFFAVQFIALFFLNFFFMLAVRPSVELKNYHYFMRYAEKIPGYFLVIFFFSTMALCLNAFWLLLSWSFAIPYATSLAFLPISPILIAALFLIDLKNSFTNIATALVNSLKFCLYFFPVIAVLVLFERLIFSLFTLPQLFIELLGMYGWVSVLFQSCFFLIIYIVALLPFSALAIYYIKVKHNHHKLFFE